MLQMVSGIAVVNFYNVYFNQPLWNCNPIQCDLWLLFHGTRRSVLNMLNLPLAIDLQVNFICLTGDGKCGRRGERGLLSSVQFLTSLLVRRASLHPGSIPPCIPLNKGLHWNWTRLKGNLDVQNTHVCLFWKWNRWRETTCPGLSEE